jgi:hypothetical protein
MSAPLTYSSAFAYLLGLGERFEPIGRSELTLTGEPSGLLSYPLLLIEADPLGSEMVGAGGMPTGLESFTIAVQVLDNRERPTQDGLLAMLEQTNRWADQLTQQLRDERGGQLESVSKLPLPGQAGTDLACGWRVELRLKIAKEVNRQTNRDLFAPEKV